MDREEKALGFRSDDISRKPPFHVGLRVLAVDDNHISLKIVKEMLIKSQYDVVDVIDASDALKVLQSRKDGFDLILTCIDMPRMNGFQLLEIVRRDFNIPVIMMSDDEDKTLIAKALESGAFFCLMKPIRQKDIQSLWQLVFTSWRCQETIEGVGQSKIASQQHLGEDEEGSSSVNEACTNDEMGESKKPRVVWTSELHQCFLDAIQKIGPNRAVPTRILEVMNVPGLSRENVASHLQKYRLSVKRSQDSLVLMNEPTNLDIVPGYPQLQTLQQRQWMPIGGYGYGSSSNTLNQIRYGKSFPIQQAWPKNVSSLNEQYLSNYPMQNTGIRTSDNLISGTVPMHMIGQQQSHVSQGFQNSNSSYLHAQNSFSSNGNTILGNIESYGTFNQTMELNLTNNNYVGGITCGEPLNNADFNQSCMDEVRIGKRPIEIVEEPSEFKKRNISQSGSSSNVFMNENQFQGDFIEKDSWIEVLTKNTPEDPFNGNGFGSFVLSQDLQQGIEGLDDPELMDFGSFRMEDNDNEPIM